MKTMEQIHIAPVPSKIVISFAQDKVKLPTDIRTQVDGYWQKLIANNPKLRNGEIFTVTTVKQASDSMTITLAESDYAHYLYSQQIGGLKEYTVRIIHPAALVVTVDNKFIFGSMGKHTSRPGIIQCCGGGIDHGDIKDGVVDVEYSITRELTEELGINAHDEALVKEFYPAYLKSGGPTGKMTIVYILRVKQTAAQFMSGYEVFTKTLTDNGDEPEFAELLCIDNTQESIDEFVAKHSPRLNEYMAGLFGAAHKDLLV